MNKRQPLRHMKHGYALRVRYDGIKSRCYTLSCSIYKHYGGRGIGMCDLWRGSFREFYDWSIASGFEPSLTLERINNDGNYEPSNCKWVTRKAQANNRRSSHLITAFGETKTLQAWADQAGYGHKTILHRLRRGWSVERALTEKPIVGRNQFSA